MKTIEYYLMRHAAYYDTENQFVSYWGMLALKASMDKLKTELGEKFPNKKLRIIHSMLPRAKHTALLMGDMLIGVDTFRRNDPSLNSDKLQITKDYVKEVVSTCELDQEICLILSHNPDIKCFCGEELELSEYLCKNIQIDEEKFEKDKEEIENDDLPF